jgi:hypothetical protein
VRTHEFRFYCFRALVFPLAGWAQSTPTPARVSISYRDWVMNPQLYSGKVVMVRGKVSLEFENFTIYNEPCYAPPEVWLMFGGGVATPTTSMWGDTTRPKGKNVKFTGMEHPLDKDRAFDDSYKHITAREPKKAVYRVTATRTGTFLQKIKSTIQI